MGTYQWIVIFLFGSTFIWNCASDQPCWMCDFETDKCGIIEEGGIWRHNDSSSRGRLASNLPVGTSKGDTFGFSIPRVFTSQRGNISFEYQILGPASMTVKTCNSSEPTEVPMSSSLNTMSFDYTCINTADVKISFNFTVTGNIVPGIQIDNITICEDPTFVSPTQTSGKIAPWMIYVSAAVVISILTILLASLSAFYYFRRRNKSPYLMDRVGIQGGHAASNSESRYTDQKPVATSDIYYSEIDGQGRPDAARGGTAPAADCTGFAIQDPVYEETGADRRQSRSTEELVDNPLYGDQNERAYGVAGQPASGGGDDLVDNPLYGDKNTGIDGGLSPEPIASEELMDNPLYGDNNESNNAQWSGSQFQRSPSDDLVDNPLYGDNNESNNAQILGSMSPKQQTTDLVDNPLYGPQDEHQNGHALQKHEYISPRGVREKGLVDNPLYGPQNNGGSFTREGQGHPDPGDGLVMNPVYESQGDVPHMQFNINNSNHPTTTIYVLKNMK